MEMRRSERVQFFQVPQADVVLPVWVFRRSGLETILGLLQDISEDGVQILTDKSCPVEDGCYLVDVQAGEQQDAGHITLCVRHIWSKPDGSLYVRNGFAFESGEDSAPAMGQILAARESGQIWLRCELAAA